MKKVKDHQINYEIKEKSSKNQLDCIGFFPSRLYMLEPKILLDAAGLPIAVDIIDSNAVEVNDYHIEENIETHLITSTENPATFSNTKSLLTPSKNNQPYTPLPITATHFVTDGMFSIDAIDSIDSLILNNEPNELLFIDKSIDGYQELLANANSNQHIFLIDGSHDGLQQIADAVANYNNVKAIHIVSHGSDGELQLGNVILDNDAINNDYKSEFEVIKASLVQDADILIYGCNFTESEVGKAAADSLAKMTGADIAASEDLTGFNGSVNGESSDWILEYHVGNVETNVAFNIDSSDFHWDGVLTTTNTVPSSISNIPDNTPQLISGISVISTSTKGNVTVSVDLHVTDGVLNTTSVGTANVSGNGTDTLTITVSANKQAHLNSTLANLTYQNTGSSIIDTLTVSSNDGGTPDVEDNITLNILAPPVATDDTHTANEDTTSTTGNVLANDTDANGDTISVTNFDTKSTEGAIITYNSDGTFDYDPNGQFEYLASGETATDSFNYTVSDGNGGADTGTVDVTITGVNDAPVAVEETFSTDEGQPIYYQALTIDSNSDVDTPWYQLTAVLDSTTSNGTLAFNSNGSFAYTPNQNFSGTDTFTYHLFDGQDNGNPVTVTINVSSGESPVAVDDNFSTNEDTPIYYGNVKDNNGMGTDYDPDTGNYLLTASTVSTTSHGTLNFNPDGSFNYTPDANFTGNDSFTYILNDGVRDSNVATVTITVNPINDAPVANDDTATVIKNSSNNTIIVLANDTDVDGDTLTVTSASVSASEGTVSINPDNTLNFDPKNGFTGTATISYTISDGNGDTSSAIVTVDVTTSGSVAAADDTATTNEDISVIIDVLANDTNATSLTAASANNGTVVINGDNTLTYIPNPDFNGTDVITYTASDGSGGTSTAIVSVTVNAVNDAPVAIDDSLSATEDSALVINASSLLSNDSDIDGNTLSVQSFTQPSNGSVVDNGDGTFTYTPNANYNGADSFTYTVTDGNGGTDTATVEITVNPVADAINDTFSVDEDGILNGNVLANDTANTAPNDVSVVTGVSNGSLTLNNDGTFTYEPNADYHGNDSFTYQYTDEHGNTESATVEITVNPVADAINDTFSVDEDGILNGNVLANDTANTAPNDVSIVTGVSNGSLTLNNDGTFTYEPNADFHGTDSFTYIVNDGTSGAGNTETGTVNVTVNPITGETVIDTITTDEDTANSVDVLANDKYSGTLAGSGVGAENLTVSLGTGPSHGSVTLSGSTFTYTPDADFHGTDSFTYIVNDGTSGAGNTESATVEITVNAVNDTPILNVPTTPVQTGQLEPLQLSPLDNVSDIDGDKLFVASASASNGAVVINSDGTITYTPNGIFIGADTITVTISDGNGGIVNEKIDVTVIQTSAPSVFSDSALISNTIEPNNIASDVGSSDTFDVNILGDIAGQPIVKTQVINAAAGVTLDIDAFNQNTQQPIKNIYSGAKTDISTNDQTNTKDYTVPDSSNKYIVQTTQSNVNTPYDATIKQYDAGTMNFLSQEFKANFYSTTTTVATLVTAPDVTPLSKNAGNGEIEQLNIVHLKTY